MWKIDSNRLLSPSLLFYRMVAIFCLIVLIIVQARLIYNTYELKNRQYNLDEKEFINDAYKQAIRNEVLFPGGAQILNRHIMQNMTNFRDFYYYYPDKFNDYQKAVSLDLYRSLTTASTMDSLFQAIREKLQLSNDLLFSLILNNISVTFDGLTYVPIYYQGLYSGANTEIKEASQGMIVDGGLTNLNRENQITSISISDPTPNTLQVSFSLYVDQRNRQAAILKQMIPTFTLSLISIIFVLLIYYFTYRNWFRQKKLADMKSDFLNSITHEFNTPISTIMVANKSLRNPGISMNPVSASALTEVIDRQAQRLQTLINQALDISQMNKDTLEKDSYHLYSLLEQIVSDYQLKIQGDISLHVTLLEEICEVSLNKFLFTTMLYNIFDNAIKHNGQERKRIIVTIRLTNNDVIIEIEDNGIGMSEEASQFIFDKFYRGKSEVATPGLGLGLFYVKQALEAHHWKLKLESKLGVGSKFCIFIPIEDTLKIT